MAAATGAGRRLLFAIPGDLDAPTGGYGYDRRLIAGLEATGWRVEVTRLAATFPAPAPADLEQAEALLGGIHGVPILVDGLAFGAFGDLAGRLQRRGPLIALVHHPLGLETGLEPEAAARLLAAEAAALACADRVVVTSPTTARLVAGQLGVAADRVSVALPGVDPRAPARGGDGTTVELIAVGTITPRKGHDLLIEALAGLADLPWRLDIHGDRSRAPELAARLEAMIAAHGLAERVRLVGVSSAETLARAYDAADLFVLASHFEGYGMAYAEAIAHGLPVVGTTGGAIADAVPAGAGVLVPPGDVAALRTALRRLIGDAGARARLAAGARAAAAGQPRWAATAEAVAAAITAAEADFAGRGFSLDWLSLREPFDRAARSERMIAQVAADIAAGVARRPDGRARVIDLACGAGSTLRGLVPALGGAQHWRLVDHDPRLLAAARAEAAALGVTAETLVMDLAGPVAPALAAFGDGEEPADLVTTSAFLDLVSAAWLERLAEAVTAAGLPFHASLSYDGQATIEPPLALDAAVIAAVNQHQRGDKGFGPALGPQAATAAQAAFAARGYRVDLAPSDWVFEPGDRAIQRAMIEGWARAAGETGLVGAEALAAWLAARIALIEAGAARMRVGHLDLHARPADGVSD